MDQILDPIRDALEGQIDFTGQHQVEVISTILLIFAGAAAFVVGFIQQNIHAVLATGLAGTLLTFLITVPPWPFWNRNPQPWLPSRSGVGGVQIQIDGKKVQ